jgi:pimeloyl-ACP methyl ester carboxylesterase
MAFLTRGKHRLYYEVLGPEEAPALLLIMGMGFSSRAWGPMPERLAKTFRVIVYDNRGSGRSTAAGPVFRIRDMADDALAVLDAAGAERAFVFGISMGGMVALELTLRNPGRIAALALGATFAGWFQSRKPSLPVIGNVVIGGALSRLGSHKMLGRALVSREHLQKDMSALGTWIVNGERVSPGVLLQQMTAVTLHATNSRLGELKLPTLVMTGDQDRLVPPENSLKLAQLIQGARFVLVPGAGHCFPLERFDDTFRELMQFFSEQASLQTVPRLASGTPVW